jgi:hypothetical protein
LKISRVTLPRAYCKLSACGGGGQNAYLNEDGNEAAIVQVHLDAASIKHYWQAVHQHAGRAPGQFLDATTIFQVYGTPSDVVMKRARQGAESGATVSVEPDHLGGFTRS